MNTINLMESTKNFLKKYSCYAKRREMAYGIIKSFQLKQQNVEKEEKIKKK